MPSQEMLASIGTRLRSARERRRVTLDQLAALTGLSKPHLSRLESGERQPSIAALLDLSAALGVGVSTLLGPDPDGPPLHISAGREPDHEANGLSIRPRSGYPGSSALEALSVTIDWDRPPSQMVQHAGEEWIYVLSGTLRLEYDGAAYMVERGECAHFDATRAHRLGVVRGSAELLLVSAHPHRGISGVHL